MSTIMGSVGSIVGSGVGVSVSGVDGEGETLGDGVPVVLVEEVGRRWERRSHSPRGPRSRWRTE